MKTTAIIISLILGAYLLREFWTLSPDREIIHPFLFNKSQAIQRETYRWMGCLYAFMTILIFCLWYLSSGQLKTWLMVAVFIQALELIEYALTYNAPWARINVLGFLVPLNITTLRFLVLSLLTAYIFIRWSR